MSGGYLKRLARDLDRWIAAGLVPAENRQAILASAAPGPRRWSAAGAAAILGAVLLALAALSFVGANWSELPKITRFALILGALWAALLGSGESLRRNNPVFGHALALVGAALFGVAIMLTAQTFNISAFRNTGILIWALGALVVAVAIPSRPVLALSVLLGGGWMVAEGLNPVTPIIVWGFIPLWVAFAITAEKLASPVAANVLGATAVMWLASLVLHLQGEMRTFDGSAPAILTALFCTAAALAFAFAGERGLAHGRIVSRWLAAGAIIAAFAAQFSLMEPGFISVLFISSAIMALIFILFLSWARYVSGHMGPLPAISLLALAVFAAAIPFLAHVDPAFGWLVVAGGVLIFAIAAVMVAEGAREGRAFTGAVGLVLFIVQTLYVYTTLFGGLLDTAIFFLIGGLLLVAMSALAMSLQRRKLDRTKESKR